MATKYTEVLGKSVDAVQAEFIERQVEALDPKFYGYHLPNLEAEKLVEPLKIDEGAQSYSYIMWEKMGAGRIAKASDVVEDGQIRVGKDTVPVHNIRERSVFDLDELRAAAFAKVPLEAWKVEKTRRVLDEKADRMVLLGEADGLTNTYGLFTHPQTPTFTVATVSGHTYWVDDSTGIVNKSGAQMLADMLNMCNSVYTNTFGAEDVTRLVLPEQRLRLIRATKVNTASPETVLEAFAKALPSVEVVGSRYLLQGLPGGSPAMFAYNPQAEYVQRLVGMAPTLHPAQFQNFSLVRPAESKVGGVCLRYPKSTVRASGI
jgi:hypothetical protein